MSNTNNQTKERLGYTSNKLSAYTAGIMSGMKKTNLRLLQNNNSSTKD